MNYRRDDVNEELHRIREEIYEETRNMTSAEKAEYMRKKSAPIIKKLGLKILKKPSRVSR